ncbi:MAG: hypothetical protein R3344_07175, partial [Acidobacteriota bacterium]|nr:hypothetical protein [Acidobacteriota bacterium]
MTLLILLGLLVLPYGLLTLAGRWAPALRIAPDAAARVGVTLFFAFTAMGHFARTGEMAQMIPPFFPLRTESILITGVLELLGAAGVWVSRVRRL